jgi:hypothetical protein
MNRRGFAAWALMLGLVATAAVQAGPPAVVWAEVDYLLAKIAESGCAFNRNGTWYDAARAVAHLQYKYSYLVERDAIKSTEDFIEKAASRSSMTGRLYWIQCDGAATVASGPWLRDQLAAYRESNKVAIGTGR